MTGRVIRYSSRVENLPDEESRYRTRRGNPLRVFSFRTAPQYILAMPKRTKPSSRKPKIRGCDCHESEYSFFRRCADRLGIPWQAIVSDEKHLDILREARDNGFSVKETAAYFREIVQEEKDVRKKTKVKTPGQNMDISKRSKQFPTPPCDLDATA